MDQPHVTRVDHDGAVAVAPVGEFDISTTEILRDSLLGALQESNRIALDLSGTTFLDSLALGAVVSASKRAREAGGWLRVVAPSSYVRRVLRVTEMDTVLGLYDTVAEAIAHDEADVQGRS